LSVFLLSFLGFSPRTASRQLTERGLDVLRVWETPGTDADFLVVSAPDRGAVREVVEEVKLPVRGVRDVLLEGTEESADEEIEALLPTPIPASLFTLDPVGWVDPPWAWCEPCRDWHERGRHTRGK
jgi:hypothetical protein